jgi:hypothetical protein
MEFEQRLPPFYPLRNVRIKGNTREFAFQVERVFFPVSRIGEHGIAISKSSPERGGWQPPWADGGVPAIREHCSVGKMGPLRHAQ